MVQDYLNRSDALWGIVTNGRLLRLLRNTARFSRPSYIEFDLEAMVTGGLYSEFVLLYRLVHASRLPRSVGDAHECLLERYHQQSIEEGGRVRERLRDGVKEALEIMGTGLLAHPDSTTLRERLIAKRIDDLGYYRQLLRLIYRLLFLMVAEERRLLFVPSREEATRREIYTRWYSVARLRERADARLFDDGESDLWAGLKQTFRLFEDANTASKLGLTALDGELFGRLACVDLIDAEDVPGPRLRNDKLLSAIWRLSTFEDSDGQRGRRGPRRRVNFAGLDVEEFGSVYEALLDYHPQVTIEGERSRFELVAGSQRKSTGSYYTPPELVRELIKSALEPVVADRLSKVGTREDEERALLSLKVCDPASGSGHFVLAAARRIGRELARVRSGEAEPNPEDYRRAVRDVIRRCIFAVDKNPLAVDLCKVALWIEGHESGLPLSFLDNHVKNGDSLVGVLDLSVLEAGVPDGAYTAVTGDDRAVASEFRKANKAKAGRPALFSHTVADEIQKTAGAFGAVAELPETSPDEVHAKETAYAALRQSVAWLRAKAACDLWTAAFFSPLTADGKAAVPTTRNVWDAVSGHLPQGNVAELALTLADEQRFFHWPLEFPDVFFQGGFDVMLGNPPWDRIKLSEKEFFAARDSGIAKAPNKAARERLIKALYVAEASPDKRALGLGWENAKHRAECEGKFVRESNRYPFTARGDINTYALFAETFFKAIISSGRAGFIVPTGIGTDDTTSEFFGEVARKRRLASLFDFENRAHLFSALHTKTKFCLITISGSEVEETLLSFMATATQSLDDPRKMLKLTLEDIRLANRNSATLAIFRSNADAELTLAIYRRVPILVVKGDNTDNTWGVTFSSLFHMANDSKLFSDNGGIDRAPLYEAKMFWHFDHRWLTFGQGNSYSPTDAQKADPSFEVVPRYWISNTEAIHRLAEIGWNKQWVIACRNISDSRNERTFVAAILPFCGLGHSGSVLTVNSEHFELIPLLLANLNALVLDYVAKQKIAGTNISYFMTEQLPVLPPSRYSSKDVEFIRPRVLELTYSSRELENFASEFGSPNLEPHWDPQRRSLLRAEMDAYYAYLYGLTKRELQYVLDPKTVMGEDYPSETFRVLKENEVRQFCEYRTQRLVLEAWDRFVADGTFDVAHLRDPQYIDRVSDELSRTLARLEEMERNQRALALLAVETPKPTLFVEGVTDVAIIEGAWSVFFPNEPIPVKVLAAGGTKEMGSLAGPGKALREVLGDKIVLALADNDAAGRKLIDDGHIRKGGVFTQLPNGIHWCLLKPTESFAAAMKAHNVPVAYWPFTIEETFTPSLRRAAAAAGAWAFSDTPQAELMDNPDLARRLFALLPTLGPTNDAYWYLMAPAPEFKEAFSKWVTQPAQRTEANYAAFEEIVRGMRNLLARRSGNEKRDGPRAA